jgi:predicted metal-dependent hydrolase
MDLEYTIVRSPRRRKLTITVERDRSVVVHAPAATAEEKIHRLVESRRQWIFEKTRHAQKYAELPHPPGKELVNGESALYLGRSYLIEIAPTNSGGIEFIHKFRVPADLADRRLEAFRSWYIARAEEKILSRVRHHARQLGVEFSDARIVDNRYRWGSCTVKNNLTFNWRLIKAPMSVIDYVVVHELAHLMEPNHTPRFWNIVKAQIANMDKPKQWLKEHGQLLEQTV